MVVPFGFSFGDFVDGLQLLNTVVAALRETGGASSEFEYTVIELENIDSILCRVQGFQATDSTSDLFNKLHFLGHTCNVPLRNFLAKLEKLEPELGTTHNCTASSSTSPKFQKYGKQPLRRVQWAVQFKNHVSDLKAAISPQLALIEILLQMISL